jgi:hypothetical protein
MEHTPLFRSNDNNGLIAEILHRGVISGILDLSDDDVRSTVLSLTRNIILVNNEILQFNKRTVPPSLYPCDPLLINDKHSTDDSSSLTPSVHIPDGINDNSDKAQELSSHHRVSGIGEVVDDEASSRKRSLSVLGKTKKLKKCKKTNKIDLSAPNNSLSSIHDISMYISSKYKELDSMLRVNYKDCCKYYILCCFRLDTLSYTVFFSFF